MALLPQSLHLKAFEEVTKHCGDHYELIGDVLVVEEIDLGEAKKTVKRADGSFAEIITASGGAKRTDGLEMNKPVFCRVMQVGKGYYDPETDKQIDLEVEVGDVILVGRMSVTWFSVFGTLTSQAGRQIGIVRENEIRMRFKGEAGYEAYFQRLQKHLERHAAA